jgi:predicted NUDIX family phosphoesterase
VTSIGCIVDNSDEVGKVHLGILLACVIPHGVDIRCAEEELITIGFRSAEDLLANHPLENWTRIALQYAEETLRD